MARNLQFETGVVALFDHIEPEGPMWRGEGARDVSCPVEFGDRFAAPPGVHLSIASIDAAHEQNIRLRLEACEVAPGGFTIVAHTWGDTRIGRLSVSWIAVGKSRKAREEGLWDV